MTPHPRLLATFLALATVLAAGCGAEDPAAGASVGPDSAVASDLFSAGQSDASGVDASPADSSGGADATVPSPDTAADAAPGDGLLSDTAPGDSTANDGSPADGASSLDAPQGDVDDPGEEDVEEEPDSATGPQCGNFACEPGETWALCSLDCPPPPAKCGDLQCTPGEEMISCAVDCDADTLGVVQCLLASCAAPTQSCMADSDCLDMLGNAAQCLAYCTEAGCVQQCKDSVATSPMAKAVATCGFTGCANAQAGAICGDGSCDVGESTAKCPADCPASGGSTPNGACTDGSCGAGETAASCPFDCDPDGKAAWTCGAAKCPAEAKACQADAACLKALIDSGECLKKCGTGSNCTNQCASPVVGNSAALAFAMCGLQSCQP